MLEQKFRGEEISLRKSIADGAVNAVTTSIYGNGALKSGLEAPGRVPGGIGLEGEFPYTAGRDPRSMCGMGNPLVMNGISGRTRGYQYEAPVSGKPDGFSLVEFGKDVVTGALLGGMSNLLFFGAGKGLAVLGG